MYLKWLVAFSLFLVPALGSAEKKESASDKRPHLGWEEKVALEDSGVVLHAKLDTGHVGSSVHAEDVKRFKKKGESYVRFVVKDRYGHKAPFERKILRRATLKGKGNRISTEYVVELGLCLGGQYFEDEVSLSNREGFSQELRLGRQSLEGHFVVDPALSYTVKPECKEIKKTKKKKKKKQN